jgi:hypothetical protein
MISKKIFKSILILVICILPVVSFAQIDPGFNPNKLIDDAIFADTQTFGGPEGIQKFLEIKNSILANTSPNFLVMLKEPDSVELKTALEDPNPNLGRLRTAAELIWDASRHSGLNPQVIIVTLQKEQGLITNHQNSSPDKLQKVLDKAMGFNCPDGGGCGNLFPGFYYQLFGNFDSAGNRYLGATKSLIKSYAYPEGRGPSINGNIARVGQNVNLENITNNPDAPKEQVVNLGNRATAALYRYTPHVFNGNYNFWRFFQEWFRYPNGTLLTLNGDNRLYIIQNGTKQVVPEFVAKARNLDLTKKIIASPNELSTYPEDKIYGPADNTVVKAEGDNKLYVFIKNVKHPVSEFVLSQRNLTANPALNISSLESQLFEQGPVLPPSDGTILRGEIDKSVYVVENSVLKLFSEFTFKQRKIAGKNVIVVPDVEIGTYQKMGFVAPLDGTLVKASGSQAVYLIEQGLKHPISAELFKNRGFKPKDIAIISKDEVDSLIVGAFAHPKNMTWLKNSQTGELYLFKEGALHAISKFVAKQRGITPDFTFSQGEIQEWPKGISVAPKDGTLISGSESKTVYLVSKSQLRPLTATAFKKRKYSFKNVVKLPEDEVEAYAKGEVLSK